MTRPADLPEERDYRPALIFTFALTAAMLFLVENPEEAILSWFGLEFKQRSLWIVLFITELYFSLMAFGEQQLFQRNYWSLLREEFSLGWSSEKRALIRPIREFILVPLSVITVVVVSIFKIWFVCYQ